MSNVEFSVIYNLHVCEQFVQVSKFINAVTYLLFTIVLDDLCYMDWQSHL